MATGISSGKFQPRCILAHDLVNKLSAIIGYCDILKEDLKPGSASEKRLSSIRDTAAQIAEMLNRHQCELEHFLQDPPKKSSEVVSLPVRSSNSA